MATNGKADHEAHFFLASLSVLHIRWLNGGRTAVPTHFYKILLRCTSDCSHDNLETLAAVLPQTHSVPPVSVYMYTHTHTHTHTHTNKHTHTHTHAHTHRYSRYP